jgi:beta-1,2-mannobiose phosphorylase / 1,2-beta-oligomannan phosphorylase
MKRHGIVVKPSGDIGATFNPAAVRIDNGRYIMLVRSVPVGYEKIGWVNEFDDNYTSHLSLWEGVSPDSFSLADPAALKPDQPYDRYGVEDPRITKIGNTYYICYTALAIGLGQADAGKGIRIALASTRDFKTFTKHGTIGPDSRCKAGVLFETGGALHFLWKDEEGVERTMLSPAPSDFENPKAWEEMWRDKTMNHRELLGPQIHSRHENHGAEPGAPPIEIEEGLLMVYSSISSDRKWTVSLMLLDKNDPHKIIAKSAAPVLLPEEGYEVSGDVNNVVFTCGALIADDRLYIYYGAADTVCAVASDSMASIRRALVPCPRRPSFLSGPASKP